MLLVALGGASPLAAAERVLTAAVAANALAPLREIADRFESAGGARLRLVPGATGALYAQVMQGAPFDLFISADVSTPRKLEEEGLLVSGTRFIYARGQLVLWSRDPSLVDPEATVLRRGEGLRLAIAHPRRAPYGAAALEVLNRLQLEARWRGGLVFGESVGKTWQFVASGNADLGFLAASQLHGQSTGSQWQVPASLHPPLDQAVGLLRRAEDNPVALAFLDYLCSPPARSVFRDYGYLAGDCHAVD